MPQPRPSPSDLVSHRLPISAKSARIRLSTRENLPSAARSLQRCRTHHRKHAGWGPGRPVGGVALKSAAPPEQFKVDVGGEDGRQMCRAVEPAEKEPHQQRLPRDEFRSMHLPHAPRARTAIARGCDGGTARAAERSSKKRDTHHADGKGQGESKPGAPRDLGHL
jgi:hypothetical protein